jgi:hypothetical protein
MKTPAPFATVVVCALAASAQALTFECRWVERFANTETVIGGNGVLFTGFPVTPHRIRLQFRVADDARPAPAGGFVGWNVGTLHVSGSPDNSDETRTPGRLNPFTFAAQPNANGNPPLPGGDPFTNLADIDATLGTQSPAWGCDANGQPLPQPDPTIRGRNSFISVYEFTLRTGAMASNYSITAGGNLIAATEWRTVGTPIPPDCGDPSDPSDDQPGSITYAPFPTPPTPFSCVLNVETVPAPGATALLCGVGLLSLRRCRHKSVLPASAR